MIEPLLTVRDVAGRLTMPEESVRRLIRSRRLLAVNVALSGRPVYRIEESELAAFLDGRRTQPLTAVPSRRRA